MCERAAEAFCAYFKMAKRLCLGVALVELAVSFMSMHFGAFGVVKYIQLMTRTVTHVCVLFSICTPFCSCIHMAFWNADISQYMNFIGINLKT